MAFLVGQLIGGLLLVAWAALPRRPKASDYERSLTDFTTIAKRRQQ